MAPKAPKPPPIPKPPPDREAAAEALRKKLEGEGLDRQSRGRMSTVVSGALLGASEPATASKTLLGG